MSKSNRLRLLFTQACLKIDFQNKWYGDIAWVEILTEYNNYKPVTKQEVNRALPDTQLTSPLKLHSFKKQIKSKDNKKLLVTFYLIANEEATKVI